MEKEKIKKEDKTSLEELKEEYSIIQKKYSLPTFKELNEDFGIEKASDQEFDILIREIRRYITDKISNYLRMVENLINPVNVPVFVFSIVKALGEEDKELLLKIHKKLSEIEVELIIVDLVYSEDSEAKFIKDSFKSWQTIKKDLFKILEKVKKSEEVKPNNNGENYFG